MMGGAILGAYMAHMLFLPGIPIRYSAGVINFGAPQYGTCARVHSMTHDKVRNKTFKYKCNIIST